MNILAIGAHPDDVEFLCAGTLFRYHQQGHKVFIALTTSGNIGSNLHPSRESIAKVRETEQLEAAKLLDAPVRFLRQDDELLVDTPATRKAVLEALRWADPDVVLTNPPFDPSTDHGMTGTLVTRVILSMPSNLIPSDVPPVAKKISVFYWDIPAGIDFQPEAYVDITGTMDLKLQALSKHRSQEEWMKQYDTGDTFSEYCTAMARFRGLQAGCKYAEGYRALRILGYMPNFKLLP